jgi:hypothetical protein
MNFALVNTPNIKMLRGLSAGRPYHMVLAQHVLDVDEVAEFYTAERGNGFILMDNGVDEGLQQGGTDLVDAAIMCGAHEMVLPDTILNPYETLMKSQRFLEEYERLVPDITFCYVLQAWNWASLSQALDNFLWLRHQDDIPGTERIKSLAITKDFEPKAGSRIIAIAQVLEWLDRHAMQFMDIHLLGIWNDPLEVAVIERRYPNRIRGVDSSLPLIYAYHGLSVHACPRAGVDVCLEDPDLFRDYAKYPRIWIAWRRG